MTQIWAEPGHEGFVSPTHTDPLHHAIPFRKPHGRPIETVCEFRVLGDLFRRFRQQPAEKFHEFYFIKPGEGIGRNHDPIGQETNKNSEQAPRHCSVQDFCHPPNSTPNLL